MMIKIAVLLSLFSMFAAAQNDDKAARRLKYNSPADQAIYAFEDEAEKLTSFELFKELERLDAAQAVKIAASGNWLDFDPKAGSYGSVLSQRRKIGQPDGAFYFAVHQWRYCSMLQKQTSKAFADEAASCWNETMEAFKIASAAGIGDASFNIARQFESGYGVTPSKFAAADWYIKAAEQHNKAKDRDQALTALEAALDAVPNHPAALRLKKAMLK
jgi:TPR repeat protein